MKNSNEEIVSVSGLSKSYGPNEVLKNIDLSVAKGSILGLVGLNGSGKTTTIECILGLQEADKGHVSLLNHPPKSLYKAGGAIVGIFDTPSLHPNLTIRQSLDHAALICEKLARSPNEVEHLLGVKKFSNYKIKHLSLGNKRRASIAQALLGNPKLIILDEPFNGLDAGGVDDVLAIIKYLNEKEGTSFILSSHQLPYLENICSHLAILHNGEICISDATNRLLSEEKLTVQLQVANHSKAIPLLQNNPKLELQSNEENGYFQIALKDMNSADLNSWLVKNGIPVTELIIQRTSLSKLFKEITSEADK